MNFTYLCLHNQKFELLTASLLPDNPTRQNNSVLKEMIEILKSLDTLKDNSTHEALKAYILFLGKRVYKEETAYPLLSYAIKHDFIDPHTIPESALTDNLFLHLHRNDLLDYLSYPQLDTILVETDLRFTHTIFEKLPFNYLQFLAQNYHENSNSLVNIRINSVFEEHYDTIPTIIRDMFRSIVHVPHTKEEHEKKIVSHDLNTLQSIFKNQEWNENLQGGTAHSIIAKILGKQEFSLTNPVVALLDSRIRSLLKRMRAHVLRDGDKDLLYLPLEETSLWKKWLEKEHEFYEPYFFPMVECVALLPSSNIQQRMEHVHNYLIHFFIIHPKDIVAMPFDYWYDPEKICDYLDACFVQRTGLALNARTAWNMIQTLELLNVKPNALELFEHLNDIQSVKITETSIIL